MQLIQLTSRRNKPVAPTKILGSWRLVRSDSEIAAHAITMEFQEGGRMLYKNVEESDSPPIEMRYLIADNLLMTEQVSEPGKEFTKIYFENDNTFVLDYEGSRSWFERII